LNANNPTFWGIGRNNPTSKNSIDKPTFEGIYVQYTIFKSMKLWLANLMTR